MEEKNKARWLKYFSLGAALIAVYQMINHLDSVSAWIGGLISILSPFLWGIFIAYLLFIPCRGIERKFQKAKKRSFIYRKARPFSILIVYLIALLILVLVFQYIIPILIQSVRDLVANFQGYYASAMERIEQIDQEQMQEFFNNPVVQTIINNLKEIDWSKIATLENVLVYAKGAVSAVSGIFSAVVSIIVSVYILLERGKIVAFLRRLGKAIFKPKTFELIYGYFEKGNEIFFKYVGSQFLDAVLVGTIASIALSIIGVKYAVLLGVMIGVANMIPYFGAIIATIIASIITIITGGFMQAIIMLVTIIILQQIDANVINPKIVGESLKISPLLVIFAVTVSGAYFGIVGMFLSVPIIALIKLILEHFIKSRIGNKKEESIEELEEKPKTKSRKQVEIQK